MQEYQQGLHNRAPHSSFSIHIPIPIHFEFITEAK